MPPLRPPSRNADLAELERRVFELERRAQGGYTARQQSPLAFGSVTSSSPLTVDLGSSEVIQPSALTGTDALIVWPDNGGAPRALLAGASAASSLAFHCSGSYNVNYGVDTNVTTIDAMDALDQATMVHFIDGVEFATPGVAVGVPSYDATGDRLYVPNGVWTFGLFVRTELLGLSSPGAGSGAASTAIGQVNFSRVVVGTAPDNGDYDYLASFAHIGSLQVGVAMPLQFLYRTPSNISVYTDMPNLQNLEIEINGGSANDWTEATIDVTIYGVRLAPL